MMIDIPSKLIEDYAKAKQEIERLGKKSSSFQELSLANGILDIRAKTIADYIYYEAIP